VPPTALLDERQIEELFTGAVEGYIVVALSLEAVLARGMM
jgi:hypothetical protein